MEKETLDLEKLPIYKVILAQYGNNIKKLVEYAKKLDDRQKRNHAARQIIEAMKIINQDIQKVDDYEKILWNHLAILSRYELDVDYPYEILPIDAYHREPEPMEYPEQKIRFRHYGKIIEKLIEKAKQIDDPQLQRRFIELILIQMKKAYLFHAHAGTYVKDELIFRDFEILSNGELKIPEGISLPHSRDILERYRSIPELENERRQYRNNKYYNQGQRKK